jgi:E3 ubiquitin-protein ligase MARCH6
MTPLTYGLSQFVSTFTTYATLGLFSAGPVLITPNETLTRKLEYPVPRFHQSFLSEVTLLKNLTSSPSFNGLVVDTLEGQIITLAVVVAFILVFLIREWVVQAPRGRQLGADDLPVVPGPPEARAEQGRQLIGEPELPDLANPIVIPPLDRAHRELRPRPLFEPEDAFAQRVRRRRTDLPDRVDLLDRVDRPVPIRAETFADASTRRRSANMDIPVGDRLFGLSSAASAETSDSTSAFAPEPLQPRRARPVVMERNSIARATEIHRRLSENPSEQSFSDQPLTSLSAPVSALFESGEFGQSESGPSVDKGKNKAVENAQQPSFQWPTSSDSEETLSQQAQRIPLLQRDSAFGEMESPEFYKEQDNLFGDISLSLQSRSDPAEPLKVFSSSTSSNPQHQIDSLESDDSIWNDSPVAAKSAEGTSDDSSFSLIFQDDQLLQDPSRLNPQLILEQENTVANDATPALATEAVPVPIVADEIPAEQPAINQGAWNRLQNWMWGDIALPAADVNDEVNRDDEHVVEDLAAEPPFVPVGPAQADEGGPENGNDGNADDENAEWEDMNDMEIGDDGDDFDGVMELIGMRGPLTGLFQNGMFCAILISATITFGLWFPYVWGKFVILLIAHPVTLCVRLPLRWISFAADFATDFVVLTLSLVGYYATLFAMAVVHTFAPFLIKHTKISLLPSASKQFQGIAVSGLQRMVNMFDGSSVGVSQKDYPRFSLLSHEALHTIKDRVSSVIGLIIYLFKSAIAFELNSLSKLSITNTITSVTTIIRSTIDLITFYVQALPNLFSLDIFNFSIKVPDRTIPVDLDLLYWNGLDRSIAIFAGYAFFTCLGAVYLRRKRLFSSSPSGQRLEAILREILEQAGGVLKVIFIISLEMLAFPLYCGILLDLALLPLFEHASIQGRIQFTINSPVTSIIVHWFAGTCYMFHFALFVTMCRKIMRKGVLYFIRDPDDPNFHPVRDVLDRSISTHLRKIGFSALVYGTLITVCLGSVVWGVYFLVKDALPIHWSSNEPVLQFPVDLLFYTFLVPMTGELFEPAEKLNDIYKWFFRFCARQLRLTWFFFGERQKDEEGYQIHKSWLGFFWFKSNRTENTTTDSEQSSSTASPSDNTNFVRDGRFVRAPASDSVRIPKGQSTLLEVTEDNDRIDGQPDRDDGLHGKKNEKFALVYVPPNLRFRIFSFIACIWVFTASVGLGMTIFPLVLGRMIFTSLVPELSRMNDVYAFSLGVYSLGALYVLLARVRPTLDWLRASLMLPSRAAVDACLSYVGRCLGFLYVYSAFFVFLPAMFALVMEFYVMIPLHSYFAPEEKHVIHFVQDWTLGVLYVRMTGQFVLWYQNSRPAEALRAIFARGWTNPDARVATRSFIVPATVVMGLSLVIPLPLGYFATHFSSIASADSSWQQYQVYRYSYPAVLAVGIAATLTLVLARMYTGWRRMIRDELYLIGERLHNFAEKRQPQSNALGAHAPSMTTQ